MTSDEMLFDPAIAIPRSYKGKKNHVLADFKQILYYLCSKLIKL
jgi:hypothetical protein